MTRTIKLAVAALAATALATPASAIAGGGAHLLGSYKVEKHIDLEGDAGDYKIQCDSGDIAIDGMWRIDNVDQDNDYVYDAAPTGNPAWDVLNSVEPVAAYPSGANYDEYTFQFVPLAGANVQGKLFLTCLPFDTRANKGHSHSWKPGPIQTTAPATFTVPGTDTYANTGLLQTDPCDTGKEIAVAPGFSWDKLPAGSDSWGKPYLRFPTAGSQNSQWDWGFFSSTGGDVTLYWRCLPLLTEYFPVVPTPHHRHKLIATFKNKTSPAASLIKRDKVSDVQVICGDHYKAMLGAWDFGYSGYAWTNSPSGDYYKKLWYLGMDPRPKARVFKVLNTDPVNDFTAQISPATPSFGALCFKDRTS